MQSDILEKIFKQYDIRGKYPGEINQEIAYLLGWALVNFAREQRKVKKIDILIGRDNRKSSLTLFKVLSKGILDAGGNVISLGLCTSPIFYFASGYYKTDDGGVMITASHLPKDYNGFKLVRELPLSVDIKSGFKEIKKIIQKRIFKIPEKKGKLVKKEVLKQYLKFVRKDPELSEMKPLKIVIDTGNAVTGIIIPQIFKKLNCKILYLFKKLDSDFPNRSLDCTRAENLKNLRREVLKRKADLGVAFDGDGDRITFLDEKGRFVSPSITAALISSILLKNNPEEKILYTVNQSRIIPEVVRENGGFPIISKVGHSNIKRKMRKENILFGGEASAHYYHRSPYFCEAPFFVLFKILKELSKVEKPFSQVLRPFKKYFYSGEINFKVKDTKKALKVLENRFKRGKILKVDGIRIDFSDWWFNARPSHTEPLLRLVIEAETKKLMEEKKKELIELIN
ncbi:MAG: phosphomannomutase/phosphoglucomutase [Candidatus Nealsonbacteria bacterium CG23_combo_of_CG06-09_8_20_14_all_37_18]|uniref:Phosphomannomutase/phosphoglucomutase n=1 Tax=Candidatus Nealsonbacteria bacterium CG23_combo_of_CG06-09_8_20_14_all_37_18 TaxID=1974720 RepID=A0A2G9YYS0_9BACT|nr:MAG: phosphomannomutase/phosphoglucomutase [Candidatus Nealsonbacteria bacterium CG23_combo_of_CG06-09_8_20_14_all_37_18]